MQHFQPSLAQRLSQHLSAAFHVQKTPAVTLTSQFYCGDTLLLQTKMSPNMTELTVSSRRYIRDLKLLFPVQCTTSLVFDYTSLKKVAFLFQIYHLTHPGKGVFFFRKHWAQSDLLRAAICDEP